MTARDARCGETSDYVLLLKWERTGVSAAVNQQPVQVLRGL